MKMRSVARLACLMALCGALSACESYDWRAAGRASLESLCRSDAGCDRSCETGTGARVAGDCRISHGQP